MSSSADADDAVGVSRDVLKVGTVIASFAIGVSYVLPWVNIDGPVASTDVPPEEAAETIAQGEQESSSITGMEITLFPEILLGIALIVAVLAFLKWDTGTQIVTGILGLVGAGFILYSWAGLDIDDEAGELIVGGYIGPPSSFEPAIGLWLALFASILLVVCGFGAVARTYAHSLE